jgi:hypothetical protein
MQLFKQLAYKGSYFMKITLFRLAVMVVISVLTLPVMAGDCLGVRFSFTNHYWYPVKVKNIEITGNDGEWTEDIMNHTIGTVNDNVYITDKRRLNKLDSGKKGTFKVNYERQTCTASKPDENGYLTCGAFAWVKKSKTFTHHCQDDITLNFYLE